MLVDREGRVLLQLRDDNPKIMYPAHWGITGGAGLAGETPEQAARREVLEETGLSVGRIEPFRAYYFQETGAKGARGTTARAKADYELYLYHAPCETPVEELVCGEGQALRFVTPEEVDELPIAYNHAEVLADFFGSAAYAAYLSGEAFDSHERIDPLQAFLASIAGGEPWFEALTRAIALWESPRETVDGREYRYLIGGEAFDWLLLAERLLDAAELAAPGAVPLAESEHLLFEGRAPATDITAPPYARLTDERLRELIGEHKHRAHLNYLYGVVVEEALQYAVELDVAKERVSVNMKDPRFEEGAFDPVYERIYGRTRADLLTEFRAEKSQPLTSHISLSVLREFMYWLFKYRVKNQEPARVASDTRKALAQLSRIEATAGRHRQQPAEPATA
jgi:8-oxo-dGTP pyrophosphatase MutT (NUDIX family)